MEIKGVSYLRQKLKAKKIRINTRYKYYEMKNHMIDLKISSPPELQAMNSVLGWAAMAVDTMADRMQAYGFDNDTFKMQEIYEMNNMNAMFDAAVQDALIAACSFIYVSMDANGIPRMQVIEADKATGIMDETTGFLSEGYAVLEEDADGNVVQDAWFLPGVTHIYTKGETEPQIIKNAAEFPLLVPIIYRPSAKRKFGHSRITRAGMYYIQAAARTVKRSEVSAEFYAFPQKYLLGTSPDLEIVNKWQASISALLMISRDEDGNKPEAGTFPQQSMGPHLDQLKMFASMFAADACLTLDDLGFPTANPSSPEAIKAQHENLKMKTIKAQRTMGDGFLRAGFLASCLANDRALSRYEIYRTKILWEPVFAPDASAWAAIGDGAFKMNQIVPDYFDKKVLRGITGINAGGDA